MIAKVILLCAVVAVTQASTLLTPGLVAPGLLHSGILAPGLSSVATSSVVSIPGAITTDRRIISSNGIITGAPLSHGIISHGIVGASPLLLSNGLISPIGLRGASIHGVPVILK